MCGPSSKCTRLAAEARLRHTIGSGAPDASDGRARASCSRADAAVGGDGEKNGSVFDAKWPHMHTTVVRAAAAATDASDGPRSLT